MDFWNAETKSRDQEKIVREDYFFSLNKSKRSMSSGRE